VEENQLVEIPAEIPSETQVGSRLPVAVAAADTGTAAWPTTAAVAVAVAAVAAGAVT
jgi:hypothetical protein